MPEVVVLDDAKRLESIETNIRRGRMKRVDMDWLVTRMHQLIEENKAWEEGAHKHLNQMLEMDAKVYQLTKEVERKDRKESFIREIVSTLENRLEHYRSSY